MARLTLLAWADVRLERRQQAGHEPCVGDGIGERWAAESRLAFRVAEHWLALAGVRRL